MEQEKQQILNAYKQNLCKTWASGYADGSMMVFQTIKQMSENPNMTKDKIKDFCDKSLNVNRDSLIALYERLFQKSQQTHLG